MQSTTGLTNDEVTCRLTAKKPGSSLCLMLVIEYETTTCLLLLYNLTNMTSIFSCIALGAQRPKAIKLCHGRSVGLCVSASVCGVHCGQTADRIQMLFGIISRTGPGMSQVVGFGDRSTGMGTFGGKFGVCHCNQWGFYGVHVRQCRDVAIFPNYFGQTCSISATSDRNAFNFNLSSLLSSECHHRINCPGFHLIW